LGDLHLVHGRFLLELEDAGFQGLDLLLAGVVAAVQAVTGAPGGEQGRQHEDWEEEGGETVHHSSVPCFGCRFFRGFRGGRRGFHAGLDLRNVMDVRALGELGAQAVESLRASSGFLMRW